VWDTNIKYAGHHYGASYIEHVKFLHAMREGLPAEVSLEDGVRSVAIGVAAHRSIAMGLPVNMADVLPAGW
jgi:myo-inositol 2-dehydrogenase / D-chiro-inositol 1-dehydrogenase